jgi:hypothetical protein
MWKDWMPEAREVFHFPDLTASRLRIRQTASGTDQWSINEVRLFSGGKEIVRNPMWRVRTNVNPWTIQRAFDNASITRWRSWEAIRPGMFVEIDLGEPVKVNRVMMETTHDHYQAKVLLEAWDGSGKWRTIDEASDFEQPVPLNGLREAAALELKAMGYRYLLLQDSDSAAQDFRERRAEWGVEVVGEIPGALLYKFK